MIGFVLAAALAAAAPAEAAVDASSDASTETENMALARAIASQGMLATIAPLQTSQEIAGVIEDHPELTSEQAERLRAIGEERSQALLGQAIEAQATAIAAQMSIEDLRVLAEFADSDANQHYRAAMPTILAATMGTLGSVDYRGDVVAQFCAETQLLCEE